MLPFPLLRLLPVAVLLLAAPRTARADMSSWLSFGGGYSLENNLNTSVYDRATVFDYLLGVGSSPKSPFVFGGLVRGVTRFHMGTDLGFALRLTTGGFARGDWGVAVEAGPVARWWKDRAYGWYPMQAVLTVGAPWGFQLAMGTDFWSIPGGQQANGYFAVLEIDLLRLTVMRQGSSDSWWKNPSPAGGRD
jgi:hypothetical protein